MSRIPEPILDALESKRCLFFVGSGVSTEAGLPSAGELVTILARKLESSGNKTYALPSRDMKNYAVDTQKKSTWRHSLGHVCAAPSTVIFRILKRSF